MVGFQMVKDNRLDFIVSRHLFQTGEEVAGKLLFDRVHHRHAGAAAHRIGVVAGAVGGLQNDVEAAQRRVQRADPVYPGGNRHRFLGGDGGFDGVRFHGLVVV